MFQNDITIEWRKCCVKVMTGHDDPCNSSYFSDDDEKEEESPSIPILDLLPKAKRSTRTRVTNNNDPWNENACRLSTSLTQMSEVLRREAFAYTDACAVLRPTRGDKWLPKMSDSARSSLESTVASFAAGTANQIEQLRKSKATDGDLSSHQDGILAILMLRLQKEVVGVMDQMHRAKIRDAVTGATEEPLSCHWGNTITNEFEQEREEFENFDTFSDDDQEDDDDDDDDLAFFSVYFGKDKRDIAPFQIDKKTPLQPGVKAPLSPLPSFDANELVHESSSKNKFTSLQQNSEQKITLKPGFNFTQPEKEENTEYMDDMRRENATILTTVAQRSSQLHGIQNVEQTMMQITSLINQFAELLTEQQEDIIAIQENVKSTKDNMDKGTDNIINVVEKGKKSAHYMAKIIFVLGIALWLMNWVMP